MSELGPSPLAAGERNVSVGQARAAIAAAVRPLAQVRTVRLDQALGRVLARDVVAPIDVPGHDNSAMDGFAFNGSVLSHGAVPGNADVELRCVGTVFAGKPCDIRTELGSGDGAAVCLRIMTGAVMPPGLDTVVPLELCRIDGDRVHIAAGAVTAGENRRRRGEDLAANTPALRAGRVLRPADLGLVASLGLTSLDVVRPLRVALFSTGDEVVAPGAPLPPGCIYDSNRASLGSALQRLGMEVVDLGLVRDDPSALEATLRLALARCDAVVTSGGVSAGDADHTRDVLARLGEVGFWKVAMRPGRPFAFGQLDADGHRAMLFALPGNPVAALVSFYALARDGLLALAGARPEPMPTLQVRSPKTIRKRPGRTEYQRGIVTRSPDGSWQVELVGSQSAGILRSMSEANALVVLHHDQGAVAAGEMVDAWLFDGLV